MFDHQIFAVQRYGGFSKYFVSLSRALRKLPGMRTEILAPAHINEYLDAGDSGSALTFRMTSLQRGLRYRPMLMSPLFNGGARWQRPDIVHETHYILQGGHVPRDVPIMATCHDMTIERQADGSPRSREAIRLKRQAFERASGIVCISANTRSDLLHHYPHLEPRVSVVHHGVDAVEPAAAMPLALPANYLLFVGMRGGYKNFASAVRALGASKSLRDNFHLVCFGGGRLQSAEQQLCADAGLRPERVLQISGDDSVLAHAYRRAAALVYPSVYEGFGMPLTEAMVHGCPVLCSNTSCFPEICGDAAAYFDPADVDSIRVAMEQLLSDGALRATLVRQGRERVTAFTWEACATGTAAAYARALAAGSRPH